MITTDLIGCFVFINQGNGNLSSIYSNIHTTDPYPETSKRQTNSISTDPFQGLFSTVWIEPAGHQVCDLEIKNIKPDVYELEWRDATILLYKGFGMIRNGELIGSYWKA